MERRLVRARHTPSADRGNAPGGVPVHVGRAAGRRSLREHRPKGRANPGDVIPGGASDRAGAIQPREQPARNGEGDARPVRGPVALRGRPPLPGGRPDAPDPLEGDGPPRGRDEPALRPRPRAGRADRRRHADQAGRLVAAQLGRRPGRRPVRRGAVVRALVHRGRDRRRSCDQCVQRPSSTDRLSCRPARPPDRSRRWPTGSRMSARSRRCRSSGCSPTSRAGRRSAVRSWPSAAGIRSGSSRPSDGSARRATLRRCAAFGPEAAQWSAHARALGVPSAGYRLDPDWQTADALERVA